MKKYIQPRNYVVNIVTESLLAMSADSGSTTDDFWTNKKDQEEDTTTPFWGDTEF